MHSQKRDEFLVALLLTSPLVSFQFFYIVLAVFVIVYFKRILAGNIVYRSNNFRFLLFLVPIFVAVVLAILHREHLGDPDFARTVELCVIFSGGVFVFDAMNTYCRNQPLDLRQVSVYGVRLLAIFLIGKLVYTLVLTDWNVARMVNINIRRNPITDYNPNHVDDYFLLFLILLGWFMAIRRPAGLFEGATVLATFTVFAFLVIQSGSVGGSLGVAFGLFVLVLLNIRYVLANGISARLPVVLLILLAMLGTGFLASSSRIGERMSNMYDVSSQILQASEADGDIARCHPTRADALPLVAPEYAASRSLVYRLLKYDASIKLIMQSPWIGYGVFDRDHPRTVQATIGNCVFDNFAHVHNLYLDIALRGGLVLLAMFLFFGGAALIVLLNDLRKAKPGRRGLLLCVVFFFSYLAVENLFDLTFVLAAVLKVNLLVIMLIWSISRSSIPATADS